MASSYTGNSGIEKPGDGDQSGSWGDTINTNMDIIDRSINGVGAITLSGTTHTLTTTDGTLSDGMYKVLVLGGSPSGTNTITIAPNDADKVYIVVNSSGQTATFTQGSGANVSVLNGDSKIIYADGAGSGAAVVDVTADLSFSSVNIDGGTIDGTVIGGASAAAGTFTTVTASGEINGGSLDIDDVVINGSTIGHTDDTDLITVADGIATVAGEVSMTTLDIGGTNVTSTATELNKLDGATVTTTEINYLDITTLGTSEASKAVTVDSSGDLIVPDSDKFKFGAGSDMQLYHDGTNSYITNGTGILKIATETSGIAINIGHGTSEVTFGDNVTVTGDFTVNGTTTTINTTNLTVTDPLVKFGQGYTGTAYDEGFIVTRGNGSASNTANKGFIWDESADEFAAIACNTEDGTTAGNVTINSYADLQVDKLTGGSLDISGDVDVDGTLETDALSIASTAVTSTAAELNKLDGATVTTTEINYLDITTLGTTQASKVVTTDSNGDVVFPDGDKINLGTGSDLQLYHDGSDSYVDDAGTGILFLRGNSAVKIRKYTGEAILDGNADGSVVLYHDNAAKLATASGGVAITGDATFADNGKAIFGAGSDLQIFHDGSDSYVKDAGTGRLVVETDGTDVSLKAGSDNMLVAAKDGAVTLYYDNAAKLATGSGGVTVTGQLDVTGGASLGASNANTNDGRFFDIYNTGADANTFAILRTITQQVGSSSTTSADFAKYKNGALLINNNDTHANVYTALGVGGSERLRITSAGKVGIGTTAPGAMLQVHSAALGTTAGDSQDILQLHSPDTSNNTVYKFLNYRHTNGSSHDQSELRWQRKVDVTNHGYIGLRNEAITFGYGDNTELMRLTNAGKLGIGIVAPTGQFAVSDGTRIAEINPHSSGTFIGNRSNHDVLFQVNAAEKMRITTAGRVGIGTGAPDSLVEISSGAATTAKIATTVSNNYAELIFEDGNAGYAWQVRSDGAQSIPTGSFVLNDRDTGSFPIAIVEGNGTNTIIVKNSRLGIHTDPSYSLHVKGSVGIQGADDANEGGQIDFVGGTSYTGYGKQIDLFQTGLRFFGPNSWTASFFSTTGGQTVNLECSGALSKGSGSFKIDHPLESKKDTHHLVHSFIEGPQADLIYRGKVDLVGGTATINIDTAANITDGTFVLLNREVQCFTTNETGWTAIKGSVSGNILTITAQDNTCTDTISWMVIGERKDPHMYGIDWTDNDGKVITEPLKPEE